MNATSICSNSWFRTVLTLCRKRVQGNCMNFAILYELQCTRVNAKGYVKNKTYLHTQRTGTDNRNHNPLPCLGPASRIHGVTIAAIPVNFKRVIYSNRAAFKIDAAYRHGIFGPSIAPISIIRSRTADRAVSSRI
jgi:hypothetical protein